MHTVHVVPLLRRKSPYWNLGGCQCTPGSLVFEAFQTNFPSRWRPKIRAQELGMDNTLFQSLVEELM